MQVFFQSVKQYDKSLPCIPDSRSGICGNGPFPQIPDGPFPQIPVHPHWQLGFLKLPVRVYLFLDAH